MYAIFSYFGILVSVRFFYLSECGRILCRYLTYIWTVALLHTFYTGYFLRSLKAKNIVKKLSTKILKTCVVFIIVKIFKFSNTKSSLKHQHKLKRWLRPSCVLICVKTLFLYQNRNQITIFYISVHLKLCHHIKRTRT